jgi:hypothetical protein
MRALRALEQAESCTTTTAGERFASVDMARHLHYRRIVLARSGDLDQAEQALSASLAARPAWSGGRSLRIADLAEVQASGGEIEHAAGLATEALAIGVQTGSVEQRRCVLRPWSPQATPACQPCGSSASSSGRPARPVAHHRQDRALDAPECSASSGPCWSMTAAW